jgi:flavorubredoxin
MQPVKLRENIWWVGAIDWDLRDFHSYRIHQGATYNAYLIIDEKVVLIDDVEDRFYGEMIERISHIIDPAKIDIIIQNHVEMDHSGSLPKFLERYPGKAVYTNAMAIKGLKMHFKKDWNFHEVKTGDVLNIGKRNLTFVTTPMVHWPDNMVTYCPEEKILFSNDAFGQHVCSAERYDADYSFDLALQAAKHYYANIVMPYGSQVQKALEAVGGLEITMIAPSHGLIWTKHIPEIIEHYKNWSNNDTDAYKAVVIYDTMWKSTRKLALAIAGAFENLGIRVQMFNLKHSLRADIMMEVLTSRYICVGSPTLNSSMLPDAAGFLYYLKGLSPRKRIGLAFGSYGWGGQSIDLVHNLLGNEKECGFTMLEPVKVQYVPDRETLQKITKQVEQNLKQYMEEK